MKANGFGIGLLATRVRAGLAWRRRVWCKPAVGRWAWWGRATVGA
jgi:hypothetical protein